jgi:hypothetical protein
VWANNAQAEEWGQRFVSRYIRGVPLLWLCGILTPAAICLLLWLSKLRWPRGRVINAVVVAWLGIGAMQALCAFLNGMLIFDLPRGLRAILSIGVYGWVMGGLGIAIGFSYRLACLQVIRAISILGAVIILLISLSYALLLKGEHNVIVPTPISLIFPKSELVRFYGTATFLVEEDNGNDKEYRMSIFAPWAVSFGLSGVAIILISNLGTTLIWRLLGVTGGLLTIFTSHSRCAVGALLAVLSMQTILKIGGLMRSILISLALVGFLIFYLNDSQPIQVIDQLQSSIEEVRAGSSMVRDMIYEESWSGFWRSPIIGNGWPGESVTDVSSIGTPVAPVGTHSSVSGLLYTGGILTFGTFVAAILLTVGAALRALIKTPREAKTRSFIQVGLCLIVTLLIFSPYESIFSDTLPLIYIFTWIGGAIRIGEDYVV